MIGKVVYWLMVTIAIAIVGLIILAFSSSLGVPIEWAILMGMLSNNYLLIVEVVPRLKRKEP